MPAFAVESNLSQLCVMNGSPDYLQLGKISLYASSASCQCNIDGLICAWNISSLSEIQSNHMHVESKVKEPSDDFWACVIIERW